MIDKIEIFGNNQWKDPKHLTVTRKAWDMASLVLLQLMKIWVIIAINILPTFYWITD